MKQLPAVYQNDVHRAVRMLNDARTILRSVADRAHEQHAREAANHLYAAANSADTATAQAQTIFQ